MPLKQQKQHQHKKHPRHYAKVYWPYLPLVIVMVMTLLVGQSFVSRSQRDVLSYATSISADTLLDATNQARAKASLQSVKLNDRLANAAQAKAEDMAQRDYWSHHTPDNKTPWVFLDSAKYRYQKAGENLAFGFDTSTETVNGWMNSPTHRDNVLDTAYTEVGFGIAQSSNYVGNGPETIVVAMYARPMSQPMVAAASNITQSTALGSPVTTAQRTITEPAVESVSKFASLTGAQIPGITFIIGLLIGAIATYLLIKHSISLKRTLRDGEKFVMKHPVFDLTLVGIILLCVLLTQSVGVIR